MEGDEGQEKEASAQQVSELGGERSGEVSRGQGRSWEVRGAHNKSEEGGLDHINACMGS